MRYAVSVPQFGAFGDVRTLVALAHDCEEASWDAFFVWDHMLIDARSQPMVDPWVTLAAIAVNTTHIHIGAMVTPLARRRPWKVARETISIDQLSGGRLIFGVGLGAPPGAEFEAFGEDADPKVRADKLDEGLEVLTGLWKGQPFSYAGKHYQLKDVLFTPRPTQAPRIPIWVAGQWPNKRPMRRAARWDGVIPAGPVLYTTPEDWHEITDYLRPYLPDGKPFDLVNVGTTAGKELKEASEVVEAFTEAGITWWVEEVTPECFGWDHDGEWPTEAMHRQIRRGPPRA